MKWTLQHLLSKHFDRYRGQHGVTLEQWRAVSKLTACRTARLGGHVQRCPNGHVQGIWYNSCKHRACPQCRGLPTERWLQRAQSVLLDCPHHHMIFTLPCELHTLWRFNRALMADVLYQAVRDTLAEFARDPRYLGAMPGIMATLHTWGRDLSLHPHLHCLITHGGLGNNGKWVEPRKQVLFPQKPLMMVFRGKFLAHLRQLVLSDGLALPPDQHRNKLLSLSNRLGRKAWVVHCCERYDHGRGVARYLARYIRGGPLRNSQLLNITESRVSFRYQSHQTGRREVATLDAESFIQRWLEHVPQAGKAATRYFGLYSSSRRKKLNIARVHLQQSPVSQAELLSWQAYITQCGLPLNCEICGEPLHHAEEERATREAA